MSIKSILNKDAEVTAIYEKLDKSTFRNIVKTMIPLLKGLESEIREHIEDKPEDVDLLAAVCAKWNNTMGYHGGPAIFFGYCRKCITAESESERVGEVVSQSEEISDVVADHKKLKGPCASEMSSKEEAVKLIQARVKLSCSLANGIPASNFSVYEHLLLFRPDVAEFIDELRSQLYNLLEFHRGVLIASANWGVKNLAYKKRKFNSGLYFHMIYSKPRMKAESFLGDIRIKFHDILLAETRSVLVKDILKMSVDTYEGMIKATECVYKHYKTYEFYNNMKLDKLLYKH